MTEISQELVERMVKLCREMATDDLSSKTSTAIIGLSLSNFAEARAIVAELPAPVDPDLVEAREIAQDNRIAQGGYSFTNGQSDGHPLVQCALTALKRGRELSLAETGK